jgi:hypothetical protein
MSTLFDAKDDAIDRVERHANDVWLDAAYAALQRVARNQPTVTADDVWEALPDALKSLQHEARAIGPVMLRGLRDGVLAPTDRIRMSALGKGRWKVRVWTSTTFSIT